MVFQAEFQNQPSLTVSHHYGTVVTRRLPLARSQDATPQAFEAVEAATEGIQV
jgi:hypothetical protein